MDGYGGRGRIVKNKYFLKGFMLIALPFARESQGVDCRLLLPFATCPLCSFS